MSKPLKRVRPIQEAKAMILEYIRTRLGNDPKKDAITGWYPIEDLADYFIYVKEKCRVLNIPLSGFKYFHAAHPGNKQAGSLKLDGYQTLIILPTTPVVSTDPNHIGHRAFIPESSSFEKPDFFNLTGGARALTATAGDGDGQALDKSQICPPFNCD
ncbi:MAG: hypothetical protein H6561_17930 [Lewinellaceae bacterium]|nr:hypothetical protein [Lewinellaceae bacterium]HPR00847.1 hypothetical protein [Saprospiraceae bacterium]